ncbi:MAG: 2-oxoacid:acceptor oxidoreductase family protein [Candidatus Kariarchaeaceae archaeon]|jgi:2-oxoglutarate ferredoxin oxidoreductase subunit gamma
MVNLSIKIVGIGGQGVQFMGKMLCESAFRQGLNVSQGVLYEPSTKGGLTLADVTLAPNDKEIVFPLIEKPEILILLAQRGWEEYKNTLSENTIILADEDNVQDFSPEEGCCKLALHLPFSRKAMEIGSENITNLVALGFLSEMLDIGDHFVIRMLNRAQPEDRDAGAYDLLQVEPEKFEDALNKASPERFKEMNLQAFRIGYQLSLDTDYEFENILAKT